MISSRSLLATLITLALATATTAQKTIKLPKPGKAAEILFIGNSLTHFHDLPAFVRAMGAADQPARKLTTVMLAPGGYTLQRHLHAPKTPRPASVIKKNKADYVVLQEQSTRPLVEPELMEKFAGKFTELCKKAKSVPVWYMTFSRQNQPEYQDKISEQYERVHKQNGGLLAPVGRAWQQVRKDHKDVELHMQDRVHPAARGTYLSACVLYGTMFGGDVRSLPGKLVLKDANGKDKVLIDLPEDEARMLRDAAAAAIAKQFPKRKQAKPKKRGK